MSQHGQGHRNVSVSCNRIYVWVTAVCLHFAGETPQFPDVTVLRLNYNPPQLRPLRPLVNYLSRHVMLIFPVTGLCSLWLGKISIPPPIFYMQIGSVTLG